jgi:peptide chain release factor 2
MNQEDKEAFEHWLYSNFKIVELPNLEEKEKHTFDPDFWADSSRAESIMKSIRAEKYWVERFNKLKTQLYR